MAVEYTNTPPEWQNEGTEPSDDKKALGFEVKEKPPAVFFNWFWNRVGKCLKELQEKLSNAHTELARNINDSTTSLNAELEKKADKKTSAGGFVGGNTTYRGSGAAVGNGAYTEDNGGAVGNGASASNGGGAVGNAAGASNGGGAVGNGASASNGGGAVGYAAYEDGGGGAIGNGATASDGGFAGGKNAVTSVNAVQLGEGENNEEKTVKAYDYTLINADGSIPAERLGNIESDVYIVTVTSPTLSIDRTYAEILEAHNSGKTVQLHYDNKIFYIVSVPSETDVEIPDFAFGVIYEIKFVSYSNGVFSLAAVSSENMFYTVEGSSEYATTEEVESLIASGNVAFASEAGVARKAEYDLTVRLNGGSAEGTDLWTYNGSTSRSINLTPDKLGAAKKDLSNVDDEVLKEKVESVCTTGTPIVEAISTDGETYTATVDGITELYNGLEITIIPNVVSTKAAVQFNLNNFGAKNLRVKIDGYTSGNSGTMGAYEKWLSAETPVTIRYVSKFDNWQTVDFARASESGMYGTVGVDKGGTGKTSVTAGSILVGNGTDPMEEKTPSEVLKMLTGKDNISDVVVGGSDWAEWANHPAMHDCSNTDLNELKTSGYYFGYTGMTNAAVNEISVIEVVPYSNDWILQRQTRLTDGKMFTRYLSSGTTWSEWNYIYTSDTNDAAKMAAGAYTGDGNDSQFIDLGFTPRAVISYHSTGKQAYQTYNSGNTVIEYYGGLALQGFGCKIGIYSSLSISNTGFTVRNYSVENSGGEVRCNLQGETYYYIAFK